MRWKNFSSIRDVGSKSCCMGTEIQFFHRMANGRKRKCTITSLEEDGRVLNTKEELTYHILEYWKSLLRAEELSTVHLSQMVWQEELSLHETQKVSLLDLSRLMSWIKF